MTADDGGIVDDALLTETGSGGLLGEGYLAERPLETYLDAAEQPRMAFASGHRGIVQETDGTETVHSPGSGYRALLALTGRRAVMVVGDGDGDRSFEVSFDAVEDVESETGFRRSRVTLRTESGVTWHCYPETVDAEDVASYIETAADAWARFEAHLTKARDAVSAAESARTTEDIETAKEACERAQTALSTARDVQETFDDSVPAMEQRLTSVREAWLEEQQDLVRDRARSHVKRAERRWHEGAYEQAADGYERAQGLLESVLEGDLPEKMATPVREDLAAIERDLERLGQAPIRRALATERAAERAENPEVAIDHWRDAHEQFRTVLELDWGREQSRFDGESEGIRDHLETAVSGLLTARKHAADQRCQEANRRLEEGQVEAARAAFADAVDHLEAAISTAQQLAPSAVDALCDRLSDVESRIDSLGDDERDSVDDPETEDGGGQTDADEVSKPEASDGEEATNESDAKPEDNADETDVDGAATLESSHYTVESGNGDQPADEAAVRGPPGRTEETTKSTVDEAVLETAVDIWKVLGWSVERIDDDTADGIARRPDESRPILLSVRCQNAPLGARDVRRLDSVAKERSDDPTPVLVTTDPVDPSAFETAMIRRITLIDAARLDELARSTGVDSAIDVDSVPEGHSQG
ncbi:restriction endonuclease [Halorhabdus rudnickae]|uniref:restriction endonuclease n=1 Tax=Halorhabdus rudnickae TaxID=1775544 RepID=UPI0010840D70|nr:restriction endonuclease [Halorhabdus rudnickae]